MSVVDSEAMFDSRMQTIGLTETEQTAVRQRGWTTHATFAHSSSYSPNNPDDAAFVRAVIVAVLGDPDHISAARLRRLFFESYTLTVQDVRLQLERTSDDPPRKLPQPERAARMARLATRLGTGISLKDGLEPSNRLIDAAIQCHDDDSIRYIGWGECTTRNQEVHGTKKDTDVEAKVWKPDATGVVREQPLPRAYVADTASDFKFRQALARRGVAFDIAGLCGFEIHERFSDVMMTEFLQEPLEGYLQVTMQQVEAADRHMFTRIAEMTRAGIRRRPDGRLPMELAINTVLAETKFNCTLMGRQAGRAASTGTLPRDPTTEPLSKRQRQAANKAKAAAAAKAPVAVAKGKGKGADKGAGKGKGKGIPEALKGYPTRNTAGEPFCFGFALGTCTACAPGAKCGKGWHLCMIPGCTLPHAVADHR